MPAEPKLLLLDGNSLANRAFYAVHLFSTSDGTFTNAVYGFLTMLYKLLDEEKPDYVAVAFDKGSATFRHQQYTDYKGTRKGAPEEFKPQLDLLREVLTALNIPWFRMDEVEADDILGTLAKQAQAQGVSALIVTGDRDALQLVDEKITTVYTKKGISETIRYTPETLQAEYGLTPSQIIDLKALMGDPSDNIPGVPGVGEKTAKKLLEEYGTVEGVYAHLDEIKGALRTKLETGLESAKLSKWLATIKTDAPVAFDPEKLKLKEPNWAEAAALFRKLEFKSLMNRVTPKEGAPVPAAADEGAAVAAAGVAETVKVDLPPFQAVSDAAAVIAFLEKLPAGEPVSLLAVTANPPGDPGRPVPTGVALVGGGQGLWIIGDGVMALRTLVSSDRPVIGHDLKPFYNWAYSQNWPVKPPAFDSILAAYLLTPGRSEYDLVDLCRTHGLGELPAGTDGEAVVHRAAAMPLLRKRLEEALVEADLMKLFTEVEMPVMPVLARMEANGIAIDPSRLHEMATELEGRIIELTKEIHELAKGPFNIGSPKQLGEVLFERLGLPAGKKTKSGGYSTDAEVLEELAADHLIAAKILDWRTLTKLKSTYVDVLGTLTARDGRIHTTFAQTVAETGRLSSKDPNLQNIPIRIEEGRRVRRAFIAKSGHKLVAADYSQIELRVVAHYSGDKALIEAFKQDQDIHAATAAAVHGVPLEQVTPEMRRQAKAVNFGLIYGQTDFGLARAVGISRAEAKEFIATYFARFQGVRQYMEEKKAEAKEKGYVTTLLGRKRPLPEINHRIFTIRQNAERMAINTPIQGTAADLMKLAMLRVADRLEREGFAAKLLLQVHDELVFECPDAEVERLKVAVREEMEGAMKLDVPLKVEVKVGPDWYSVEKA
jgi:DNA polymerase-1